MKLAITIATFYHKDGGIHTLLSRTLNSIKNQTHQDYMVYLIGDDYEKPEEFFELSKIIDKDKIKAINLPVAVERSKYKGAKLWVCGGVNASNTGINMALKDGLSYVCHLDHDDYWEPNHLKLISDVIDETKTNFVCTKAFMGKNKSIFPNIKSEKEYINFIPKGGTICHSSTCVNFNYFKFRYRNLVELFNQVHASDADLWNRIKIFYEEKKENGILINKVTCNRDKAQEVIHKKNII